MNFQDKVVVITGAGQGLGAACAKEFAALGATVVLLGRTLSKVEAVAAEIGAKALGMACDVGNSKQVKEVFASIQQQFGRVDVLINNAAIHKSRTVYDISEEDWNLIVQTNLNGAFYCIRNVIHGMMAQKYGKIINISSNSVHNYYPGFSAYASAKGGMVVMTKILSEEVKQFGINVNAVNLGMTNTEKTRERFSNNDPAVKWSFDDMLQVDDAARVIAFLASDEGAPIMGAAVDVDGPIR